MTLLNFRRRRRKRNASHSVAINDSNPLGLSVHLNVADAKNTDDPTKGLSTLRVATKTEWKRLRNVYLTLQRKKYSEVKKLLQSNRQVDSPKVSTLPLSTVRPVTMKSKPLPPPAKRICTRNINFYGANRDEHNANTYECSIVDEKKTDSDAAVADNESPIKKKLTKDVQFEFERGLIVKVNFEEPCTDTADFKGEMRQYGFVKYIDVNEGQMHAYVRVDNPRSAPALIKHCAPNRCQILTGESETEYWAKISKDREQKLSKAVKVPRNRNRKIRNIIKNIAEINVVKTENKTTVTHIRFDDD